MSKTPALATVIGNRGKAVAGPRSRCDGFNTPSIEVWLYEQAAWVHSGSGLGDSAL